MQEINFKYFQCKIYFPRDLTTRKNAWKVLSFTILYEIVNEILSEHIT